MTRQQLHIALRTALLSRDVRQIRILLATYGLPAFSGAVAGCSPRTAADALSLLSSDDRHAVLCHLPRTLCEKLRPLGIALPPAKPVRHLSWSLLAWRDTGTHARS
ncbi:MAG: hypothetical protein JO200_04275 [Comamonas sp.]|nr:hypothetical protein [Comamonas sp.]